MRRGIDEMGVRQGCHQGFSIHGAKFPTGLLSSPTMGLDD